MGFAAWVVPPAAVLLWACSWALSQDSSPARDTPPPGVEQILPRGGIPAIFQPTFVPAANAKIPDHAWVLGVQIQGEARAYSLNLLNGHEVVNDEVAGRPIAAVWWPLANTAVVYDRQHQDAALNFEASGALMDAALVMRDRETDSWWSIMTGRAIGGELEGTPLEELPVGEKATWGEWRQRHPQSLVLSVGGKEFVDNNPYDSYFTGDGTFRNLQTADDRLKAKTPVYSFRLGEVTYATPHTAVEGGALFPVEGETRRLLLYRDPAAAIYASTWGFLVPERYITQEKEGITLHELVISKRPLRLTPDTAHRFFESLSGAGLETDIRRLTGFDTFWYTWVAVNPHTRLLQ